MRTKIDKQAHAAAVERAERQKNIIEKLGAEAIVKARVRLCSVCKYNPCVLYPITFEGKDCPYYEKEAKHD
ncbi:hypothetical protein ES703_25838 [subsurface metagenome]